LGVPQDQARTHLFLNREEIELLPQDAMIALLRLFEAAAGSPEVILGEPRGAVDALRIWRARRRASTRRRRAAA